MPNSWRKSTSNNADDNNTPINNPFQSIFNILKNTIQRVLSLSIKTAPILLPVVFIILYGPTLITQVPKLGTLILSRLPIPPKSNKSDKNTSKQKPIKTSTIIIKPNKQINNKKQQTLTSSYKLYASTLFSSPSTIREPKPENNNNYIEAGTKTGSGPVGKSGSGQRSKTGFGRSAGSGGGGGKIDRYALDKASKLNIFERILLLKDILMGN